MSIVEQYRSDLIQITENTNDFGVEMSITNGTQTLVFSGLFTEHNNSFSMESMESVNDRIASATITEKTLIDSGYPYKNTDGIVHLLNNIVTVSNTSGQTKQMIVVENMPDRNIGLIVLNLGNYGVDT